MIVGACPPLRYVGAEHTYGNFVAPFAVLRLHLTEGESQLATSVYWGSIMLGRLACIPASIYLSPTVILASAIGGSAVMSVAMASLLVERNPPPATLWACSALFGIVMAPQVRVRADLLREFALPPHVFC